MRSVLSRSPQSKLLREPVAQRDSCAAEKTQRGVDTPKLNNAEGALTLAWAALKEKRYEGAITEAHKASQLARGGG